MSVAAAARPFARVVEHHLLVYRRTWRGTLFSTFFSPILFLAAIGIGLGSFIDDANPAGIEGVGYLAFLAPGLLVAQAMQTAAFESTYPVMAGIRWLKTYVAMIVSPLDVRHVAAGQLIWTGLRVTFGAAVFALVMAIFGAIEAGRAVLLLPVAALTGLAFAAPIQAFAAAQKNDSAFASLFRFVITPMFIFSGTFFPVTQLPDLLAGGRLPDAALARRGAGARHRPGHRRPPPGGHQRDLPGDLRGGRPAGLLPHLQPEADRMTSLTRPPC